MNCLRCGKRVWEGEGFFYSHRNLAIHRLCALQIGGDHARYNQEKQARLAAARKGTPRKRGKR